VSSVDAANSGKTVLITGAGGCIGSSLAKRILASGVERVVLLDHSEQNLHEIHSELRNEAVAFRHVPVLGDICDKALLDELFEKYRPDAIFHAAAFKHVPLTEANPIAVIRNNILGTSTLANTALQHGTGQLVMVSTDKAANPRCVMGAAKRVAELILLRVGNSRTHMSSLRLANVLGSTGSVVPLFQQQIVRGEPVTVTHPDACRYFISLSEAVDLILAAAMLNASSAVLLPEFGAPVKILDLAKKLTADAGLQAEQTKVVFTGLRPGDKLAEDLHSPTEWLEPTSDAKLRRINGRQPPPDRLDSAIQMIAEGVCGRNLPALFEVLCELVPEYQPSETIRAQCNGEMLVVAQHRYAPTLTLEP
jgi:FlaA1/EpsC-like NDP-sugar epimerase